LRQNLDDMNPQIYGYFLEKALAANASTSNHAGANEKESPRHAGSRFCASHRTPCIDVGSSSPKRLHLARGTYRAQRRTLPREFLNVATAFGDVRIKISRVNGLHPARRAEFDDAAKLAVEKKFLSSA